MKIHEVTVKESASFGYDEYLSEGLESKYLGLYANINDARKGVVEVAKEIVRLNSKYEFLKLIVIIKSDSIVVTTSEGSDRYVLDDRFKPEYIDHEHHKMCGYFSPLMYWELSSRAEISVDDVEVRESLNF